MPTPFEAVLLGLAAWRVWHLPQDDILDPIFRHVTAGKLRDFIECPFCLGFWTALAWAASFAIWPNGTPWVALPFALNAGVILVNHWLTSDPPR